MLYQISSWVKDKAEDVSGRKNIVLQLYWLVVREKEWELRYRNDNSQYQLIEALVYDDEKDAVLENALAAWFIATNAILDEDFFVDIMNATGSLMGRLHGKFDDQEVDEAGDLFVDEVIEAVNNEKA